MAPSSAAAAIVCLIIAAAAPLSHAVDNGYTEVDSAIVSGNSAKARRILGEMVRRGETEAMYRLANLYRAGTGGVPQNLTESARLYEQAASAGHVPAQYMAGQCYERGIGTAKDIVKAGQWYTRAARAGDARAAAQLQNLSEKPADLLAIINMPNEDAVLAALSGRDLTVSDGQGQTLLMAAAAAGHVRVVEFLLGANLDSNQRDRADWTALFYAAEQGHGAVIATLFAAGADPNAADRNGDTPLHLAIAHGQQRAVDLLTQHGADLSVKNAAGWSAAQLAQAKGIAADPSKAAPTESLDPTTRLAGLRKDKRFDGWPDLSIAAWSGDQAMVKLLLPNAPLNANDPLGHTALSRAVETNHAEIVALLLAAGARSDVALPGGQTPLLVAIQKGYDPIALVLLAAGSPTDTTDDQGRFPLGIAAARGSDALLGELLAHHADVNVRGNGGRTALMIAAESGVGTSLRALLEHGANTSLTDKNGRTALWYAAGSADSHDVTLLLTALVQVPVAQRFAADTSRVTPLHRAVSAHAVESVDALLRAGHSPNIAADSGSTPLHVAAIDGDLRSAALLTAAGAELDARDSQGNTPLFQAAKSDQFEMAKYLLQQGADPRIRNSNSASAYDLARADSEPQWLAMFEENSRSVLSLLTR